MAELTITVTNTLNIFGADSPSLWGELVWGVGNWATVDIGWSFDKGIANAISSDSDVDFPDILKGIENTLSSDSAIGLDVLKGITNAISSDSAIGLDSLKGITNAISSDSAIGLDVLKGIENTLSSDSSIGINPVKGIDNNLTVVADMSNETLQDSAGYYYLFDGSSTNLETRAVTSYNQSGTTAIVYTQIVASTTTWSQL